MKLSSPLPQACLRFVLATGLLLWLNHRYGMNMVERLLPLLRYELTWLDDNYRIINLTITKQAADPMILLDLTPARHIVVSAHFMIRPDPRIHGVVNFHAGSVLEPVIIGLVALSVWPAKEHIHYALRYVIGLPLLLLILPFDAAFVLLGELWKILTSPSGQHDFSLLVAWTDFIMEGGRQGLALFMAIIAIAGTHLIAPLFDRHPD